MFNFFKRKRAEDLKEWVVLNYETMPSTASGRDMAEHVVVMLKVYGQDPTSALMILSVAESAFMTEGAMQEAEKSTKH